MRRIAALVSVLAFFAAACGAGREATSSTSEESTVTSVAPAPTAVPLAAAASACALERGTRADFGVGASTSTGTPPTSGARRISTGSSVVAAMSGDWTSLARRSTTTEPPVLAGPAIGRRSGQQLTDIWLGSDGCNPMGLVDDGGRLWMAMCPLNYDGSTTTDLYALEDGEIVDHLVVAGYNCLDLVGAVGDRVLLRGFPGPTSIVDQLVFRLVNTADRTEVVQPIAALCPGYDAVPVGSALLYCRTDGANGSLVEVATATRIDPGSVPAGDLDPQDPRWQLVESDNVDVKAYDVRDRVAGKPDRWTFAIDPGGCQTALGPTTALPIVAVWDATDSADTYTIKLLDGATGAPMVQSATTVSSVRDPSNRTLCHVPLATANAAGVWFLAQVGLFFDDLSGWTKE